MSDQNQRYLDQRPAPLRPSPAPRRLLLLAAAASLFWWGDAVAAPAIVIKGKLMEPAEQIISALGLTGKRAIDENTEARIRGELDGLGYQLELKRGTPTVLKLKQYRIIRKIFVKGNWPLFEEEILRRLRFRPGQRLPEGQELVHAISRQEERMKRFLSREGYFEGNLRIQITPSGSPSHVNLSVELFKGRRYKVGDVDVARGGHQRTAGARRFEGSSTLSQEEMDKIFKHWILFYQRTFNTVQFKKDVKTLIKRYQELDFPGVRVREKFRVDPKLPPDKAVRIQLRVNKRKRITVRFEGIDELSAKDLKEVLTLNQEGAYDDYEMAQSAKEIHRLYQSKGHLQAKVRFSRKVGILGDEVTFHITEGPYFRVDEIRFTGNRTVSEEKLLEVIKTRTFPLLGYIALGEGGYVTDTQLKQDVERIEDYYREQGFADVSVQGEIAPAPALLGRPGALAAVAGSHKQQDGDLVIRFNIIEGQQTLVEEVQLEGNRLIESSFLLSQLTLKPGRPFTTKALTMDKARLARIYAEKGYPYAEVRAFEEMSLDGTSETVQFSVQEGIQVRFGPIFIRGNFKTKRSVLLSDLPFVEGDLFDIRKIEQAEAAMRRRQIFNVVRLQLIGTAEKRAVLPLIVRVEERYDDYGAIEFGAGGSTDNLLFGSVWYTNKNLLGFGTSLTLKGEAGLKIQSGNLVYRDPRLLGSTFILSMEGFVRNQLTERLGEVFTIGGNISLSKELLPRLTGLLRYEIRRLNHNEDLIRPAGVDEERQAPVPTLTAAINPALVYDRRDNPLNPTSGFRLGTSLLWASPYLGGWNSFLKLNVNGQAFIPLPKGMTIALSVRYDHGFPFGGDVALPKVERFYAGGDTTIRGFEQDRAWVEKIDLPLAPVGGATQYILQPQGGNIRLLTNLEFQFPIWRESIVFGLPLMGALFIDNGFVCNSLETLQVEDFRHGAGLALRIITPVGFSSFEYAWPLDPQIGDPETGRFHFNFGFVF